MLKVLDDDKREGDGCKLRQRFQSVSCDFPGEKKKEEELIFFCWLYQCHHANSLLVVKFWNQTGGANWSGGGSPLCPGGMPAVSR